MNVDAIINRVVESINTKTVIGEVMEIDGLKLIPIMSVSFGFGGGSGDEKSDNGSGTGGGGGARMKVTGILVVKDGDVRFIQTGTGGAFGKLIDSIPDLLEKLKEKESKEDEDRDDD